MKKNKSSVQGTNSILGWLLFWKEWFRHNLSKEVTERPEWNEGTSHEDVWENSPGRGRPSAGSELGACLAYSRTIQVGLNWSEWARVSRYEMGIERKTRARSGCILLVMIRISDFTAVPILICRRCRPGPQRKPETADSIEPNSVYVFAIHSFLAT